MYRTRKTTSEKCHLERGVSGSESWPFSVPRGSVLVWLGSYSGRMDGRGGWTARLGLGCSGGFGKGERGKGCGLELEYEGVKSLPSLREDVRRFRMWVGLRGLWTVCVCLNLYFSSRTVTFLAT